MTLSPDGRVLITVNSGTEPFSFSIVHEPLSTEPRLAFIPEGVKTDEGILNTCFMGLAIPLGKGTSYFYASEGDDGTVMVQDYNERQRITTISLNTEFRGRLWEDSYSGALTLTPDGKRLYVVDQMNFRVVGIDMKTREITDVVSVDRYPFGISCTLDGESLYVANIGMFEYNAIQGFDPKKFAETGLSFPPFAYLSEEMVHGTTVDGKVVLGLGDPNVPEAVSVYAIDVCDRNHGRVVARVKTGILVGRPDPRRLRTGRHVLGPLRPLRCELLQFRFGIRNTRCSGRRRRLQVHRSQDRQ